MKKGLWEILIPRRSNEGKEFSLKHHKEWDDKVRGFSGGLTVLKPAKGEWISPDYKLFREEMIPVRAYCTESEMKKIADYTLKHYNQKAVMYYQISNKVVIKHR